MNQTTGLTFVQHAMLEAKAKAEQDAAQRDRTTLLTLLRARFEEPPAGVVAAIEACDDLDRLSAAIVRAGTAASLADFSL